MADIHKRPEEVASVVKAVEYQSVAAKIAGARETTVVPQKTGDISCVTPEADGAGCISGDDSP